MKKYHFEKSVRINCDINELFDFHRDVNNLSKISPGYVKTEIVELSDNPLKLNSKIVLKVKLIILSIYWHIRISELQKPHKIVDLQEKGIFKYWMHTHQFEGTGNGVVMTDKIEFIPPIGVIGLPFVKLQLMQMFRYRHKKTKEIFEKGS